MSESGRSIRSMTGYATLQGATEDQTAFTLTIKSVNHRFLDLQLRLPADCEALDLPLRRAVKERVTRGHVDLTLNLMPNLDRRAREATVVVRLDRDLLAAYITAFHEAVELLGPGAEPAIAELLKMPGVLGTDRMADHAKPETRGSVVESAVLGLIPEVLDRFNAARAAEGAALASEMRASMLRLRTLAAESAALRSGAREAHFARLRARIGVLLELPPGENGLDQRLLAEAAMLVERSDVEEELVRLQTHIDSFLAMLEGGGELGKRLDFLLQELNREANTMLSKTTGANGDGLRLTGIGLEMKVEIERVREQVQNLE